MPYPPHSQLNEIAIFSIKMSESTSLYAKAGPLLLRLIGFSVFFLILVVIGSLFQFQVLGLPAPFDDGQDLSQVNIGSMIIFWTMLTAITFLSIYLLWIKFDKESWKKIGLIDPKSIPNFLYGTGLGVGMVTVGYIFMWILGLATFELGQFAFGSFMAWLLFFLIQPFFEELLFRGYILRLIERYYSTWAAIIISSILFGLIHAPNENFSYLGLISIGLSGLLMGWLFVRTGSLWAPTGLHFSWNFFQGVVFGYPTSGINTYEVLANQYSGPEWLSGGDFGFEGSIFAVLLLTAVFIWELRKGKPAKLVEEEPLDFA